MTVIVQAEPYATFTADFIPDETIGELVQRIKDNDSLEFRGSYTVQDASQAGRVCDPSEKVLDGRLYWLTVAIAS